MLDQFWFFFQDENHLRGILLTILIFMAAALIMRILRPSETHVHTYVSPPGEEVNKLRAETERHGQQLQILVNELRETERHGHELQILRKEFEQRRVNNRQDNIQDRLELDLFRKELEQLRIDNITLLTFAGESDDLANEPFRRVLPVSLYASIDDRVLTGAAEEAAQNLMKEMGFDLAYAGPSQAGSWYKNLWFWTVEALSRQEFQNLMARLELGLKRALELMNVDRVQSKVDLDHSNTALNLVKTFDRFDEAMFVGGSAIVAKTISTDGKSRLLFYSPSQEEMELLKSNPRMQFDSAIFDTILGNVRASALNSSNFETRGAAPIGSAASTPPLLEAHADQPLSMQTSKRRRRKGGEEGIDPTVSSDGERERSPVVRQRSGE